MIAHSYTPLYSWASPCIYKKGMCRAFLRHVVEHTTHHTTSRTDVATLTTLDDTLSLSPSLSRDACNPYYEHPGVR
jgi:hypothetical protein